MSEDKTTYEVWNLLGSGKPELVSEDPVEIVNWLRSGPNREGVFNVHPVGHGFHRDKKIAHDFIWMHREVMADHIVKEAFKAGDPNGVAQEIIDLVFGR